VPAQTVKLISKGGGNLHFIHGLFDIIEPGDQFGVARSA
jgi:hypothetical protein